MQEEQLKALKETQKEKRKEINALKADLEMYKTLAQKLANQINQKEQEYQKINNLINGLNDGSCITDHALVRYLERNGIINIQELKQNLLTDAVVNGLINGAKVVCIDGTDYVVSNGKVVTTYKDKD